MKKIDLHIHTVQTISDRPFTYSLDTFKKYVSEARLDAVAVTNHDCFDGVQFRAIQGALDVVVFPGIEINVESGHVLVIGDASGLEDFELKTSEVSKRITKRGDRISVDDLKTIFGNLNNYLIVPHYDKGPSISSETLAKLGSFVCAGEVDSAKKFVRVWKDPAKLTPVLFSDGRMQVGLERLPTRHTFIDCGALTLSAIKACLQDRTKVTLSESDGNNVWEALAGGQKLSTGLNVVLGSRSSGKTHTLDEINETYPRIKYIKQFDLVQTDETAVERDFKEGIAKKRGVIVDGYLSGLKSVVDDVMDIDLSANDRAVEQYLASLLKSAEEGDRQDAFSKTALFVETTFPIGDNDTLVALISSVRQVIENVEFKATIDKHLDANAQKALKNLARELIELLWERTLDAKKKRAVNGLIQEIKKALKVRSSAVQVEEVDLYQNRMDVKRILRFKEIVGLLKKEEVIIEESIRGFRIEARKAPFSGAVEIKDAVKAKTGLSGAFKKYDDPYEYLRELRSNDGINRGEIYKLFVKITYRILNKDGFPVSGGERSEFRLLEEISEAQNFDMLLIDEPESSFDNLFLRGEVNQLLKSISMLMPVVVVTHNNSVGASIGADYLLYTSKELEDEKVIYRIYSGYPADKKLVSMGGKEFKTHTILMDSLEAGIGAYESRRQGYEATKD